MLPEPKLPTRPRFGPFEVDTDAEELLRSGQRIRLPGQPFQILLVLLSRPGEVVTREQLRAEIWSEGTFVDFEHGLNAAINRLRRALGDSADNPRYIETVPNRGYRFIGRLEPPPASSKIHAIAPPSHEPESPDDEPDPPSRRRIYLPIALALTAMGLIAAAFLLWKPAPPSDPLPAVQFTIPPPAGAIFSPPIARQSFAISPDGTRLAFIVTGSTHPGIWMRELSSSEPHSISGTAGAWTVFWAPDSRSIFYSDQRAIKQVNIETGALRTVATTKDMAMYGTWVSPEDLLLYLGPTTFYELSIRTGALRDLSGQSLRWAQALPDSDYFIHVVFDPAIGHYHAVATNLKTHQSTTLMETNSRVQYAPPLRPGQAGYLLYIRNESLVAQSFDAANLRLGGEPVPLVQNVTHFSPSATGCFSVSNNGVLVYQVGSPASELRWYDRAGHVVSTAERQAPFTGAVRSSPDGRNAAVELWSPDSGGADLWVFARNGKQSRRLTYPPAVHTRVIWSPDGSHIAFASSLTGAPSLSTLNVDESGAEQSIVRQTPAGEIPPDQIQIPTDWSPDGRFIVYDDSLGEEERQVWLLDTTTHHVQPLLQGGSSQWGAAFSPDGKQLAFISDESGHPEVYLQAFEASPAPRITGPRTQISRGNAWLVRWRPDGRELFYVGLDAQLYSVAIIGATAGEPKPLFRIPGNPQSGTASDFQFDVTSNGQQFVMTTVGAAAPPDFVVIQNWQSRLRR